MTRRDFILGSSSALAASAFARPIRSSLGGRVVGERLPASPYDAEIEYLESTGTQWIDTGIKWDCAGDIKCRFSFTANTGTKGVFGSTETTFNVYSNNSSLIVVNGAWIGYVNWSNVVAPDSIFEFDLTERRIVNITTQQYRVFTGSDDAVSLDNIYLFRARNYYGGNVRIEYFRCKSIGLSVEMIPVRFTNEYGETEGAMYEILSGRLLRNKGTGKFLIGPDVE